MNRLEQKGLLPGSVACACGTLNEMPPDLHRSFIRCKGCRTPLLVGRVGPKSWKFPIIPIALIALIAGGILAYFQWFHRSELGQHVDKYMQAVSKMDLPVIEEMSEEYFLSDETEKRERIQKARDMQDWMKQVREIQDVEYHVIKSEVGTSLNPKSTPARPPGAKDTPEPAKKPDPDPSRWGNAKVRVLYKVRNTETGEVKWFDKTLNMTWREYEGKWYLHDGKVSLDPK